MDRGPAPQDDSEITVVSKKPPQQVRGSTVDWRQVGLLLEGRQLGTFRLDQLLGSGGMGAVFRATDLQLDRQVAVKVLNSGEDDPEAARRFRVEAQSAARLDHQNIARVYHVGQDQGWNYIVLELVEGRTLRQLVAERGPLNLRLAVHLFRQLAAALFHAHQRNIIHRDIKPSNVLVTDDFSVKIVDMGLARIQQSLDPSHQENEDGVTLGTFDYIAPEQARDPRQADQQSDLYSLGCTLYFSLVGRPPFSDGSSIEKILHHSSAPRPSVLASRPDLPAAIDPLVARLMAARKEDRPANARLLERDLVALINAETAIAPGVSTSRELGVTSLRLPLMFGATAASLIVISFLLEAGWRDPSISLPPWPVGPQATSLQEDPGLNLDSDLSSARANGGDPNGRNGQNGLGIDRVAESDVDSTRPIGDRNPTLPDTELPRGEGPSLAGPSRPESSPVLPGGERSPLSGSETDYSQPRRDYQTPSFLQSILESGGEAPMWRSQWWLFSEDPERSAIDRGRLFPPNWLEPHESFSIPDVPDQRQRDAQRPGAGTLPGSPGPFGNADSESRPATSELRVAGPDAASQITTIQVIPGDTDPGSPRETPGETVSRARQNVWTTSGLSQAIAALQRYPNVHTIELSFDGVHTVEPLRLPAGNLRSIQASGQHRPVLRFTSPPEQADAALLVVEGGGIEFSGIDFLWETGAGGLQDRRPRLIEVPAVQRSVFQNCSFTHNGPPADDSNTALPTWIQVNTLPITAMVGQRQGVLSFTNCAFRGSADVVDVRFGGPLLIRFSSTWAATAGSLFRLGGPAADSTQSSLELELDRCTILAAEGLLRSTPSASGRHSECLIYAEQSLLATLDPQGALIQHRGGTPDTARPPFLFEGVENAFATAWIWRLTDPQQRSVAEVDFAMAGLATWFRQENARQLSSLPVDGFSINGPRPSSQTFATIEWQSADLRLEPEESGERRTLGPDPTRLRTFPDRANTVPLRW